MCKYLHDTILLRKGMKITKQMVKNNDILRVVYSQRAAGFLMQKGFVLVKIAPDKYNPNKNIFLFNNSDALDSALKEYASQK